MEEVIKLLLALSAKRVKVDSWDDLIPLLAQIDPTINKNCPMELVQDNLMLEYGLFVTIDPDKHIVAGMYDKDSLLYEATYAKRHKVESFEDVFRRTKISNNWNEFFDKAEVN